MKFQWTGYKEHDVQWLHIQSQGIRTGYGTSVSGGRIPVSACCLYGDFLRFIQLIYDNHHFSVIATAAHQPDSGLIAFYGCKVFPDPSGKEAFDFFEFQINGCQIPENRTGGVHCIIIEPCDSGGAVCNGVVKHET